MIQSTPRAGETRKAVSYTHLDVYKRQGRLWVIRRGGYMFDPTGETHPPELTRNELEMCIRDRK